MIIVCPRCNTENRIADHPNPKVKYRCGKCRFPFTQLPAMTCPQCGVSAAQGNLFCTHCGTELPQGSAECPRCGFTVRPDAKLCGQCGQSLKFKGDTIKGLSKPFFLSIFVGSILLLYWLEAWRISALVKAHWYSDTDFFENVLGIESTVVSYFMIIIGLIFWYKAWASIQDGFARTTPGKAIVLMLIPLYNLYWFFELVWGFAKDYNAYTGRHQITAKKIRQKLYLAFSVIFVANYAGGMLLIILSRFWTLQLPVAQWVTLAILPTIIYHFLIALVINRTCDAVNTLAEYYKARSAQDSETQPTI